VRATGATVRREKARAEMRDAILASARRLLADEGVEALSIRAIARELGYSPAALYEYFPAKEDIYCALYFEGAGGLAGRMHAALSALPADATAAQRMSTVGQAYRVYALEQPELYRLVFGSGTAGFTPGAAEMKSGSEAFQMLIDIARVGVEDGTFQRIEPEAIALACWSMVHGFVLIELSGMVAQKLGPDAPAADDLFSAALGVLGNGIMRR
jgi:AcrR family transcriptional regulator